MHHAAPFACSKSFWTAIAIGNPRLKQEEHLKAFPHCQSKDFKTRGLESTLKKWMTLNAFGSKSSFAPSDARDQAALGTA